MAGKDLKEASLSMASRKKLLKTPVPMRPDTPDNLHISKAEFIARRRKEKEEAVAVEDFKKKFREEKKEIKEVSSGVQEEKGQEEVKRGRPKKID